VKKCYESEVESNGTVWTVDASTNDGRVKAEVMAASEFDGTVELQLAVDGNAVHLGILQGILEKLQTELVGRSTPGGTHGYRIKKGLPNAYKAWTDAEHDVLLERWDAGDTVDAIAQQLGRGRGGVRSRLVKLGRIEGVDRGNESDTTLLFLRHQVPEK
jgi:hypothetical protein